MQATESILKLHAVPRRWKSEGECSVACGLCSGHVCCFFVLILTLIQGKLGRVGLKRWGGGLLVFEIFIFGVLDIFSGV